MTRAATNAAISRKRLVEKQPLSQFDFLRSLLIVGGNRRLGQSSQTHRQFANERINHLCILAQALSARGNNQNAQEYRNARQQVSVRVWCPWTQMFHGLLRLNGGDGE